MPLDRLILILVVVIAAAGVTVWGMAALFASFSLNPIAGIAVASVLALGAYIMIRVVSERMNNTDDDHYDNMEN